MTSLSPITQPLGFLWGTASSAHQTEGNNTSSDAWLSENVEPTVYEEPSRDACDSYHRFGEDIAIASQLGCNLHRFGIEWARIEPEPGRFSIAELDHYRRVLEACHAADMSPMVTYSHFTVPQWFAARGGFEVPDAAELFSRFCETATKHLGDLISYASTFNEANIQRLLALVRWSDDALRRRKDMLAECARRCGSDRFSSILFAPVEQTEPVMLRAHEMAMAAMRSGPGNFPIGLTLSMQDVQSVGENSMADEIREGLYGPWIDAARDADFVGVQTYTRLLVGPSGRLPPPPDAELTAAGYEFYPEALRNTIRLAAERTGRPLIITENGVATDDDTRRIAFLDRTLTCIREALVDGLDVRGYVYWSLLDNFEWMKGYHERFGVVAIDHANFTRIPKPSAWHLSRIIESGQI